MRPSVAIEVRQHDWIPGFAAFLPSGKGPQGEAQVILNVGGLLACVENADMEPADIPYIVAESIMHEVIHVLEQWAGVEFSEARVEVLLARYRAAAHPEWRTGPDDESVGSEAIVEALHEMTTRADSEEDQAVLLAAMALIREAAEVSGSAGLCHPEGEK